MCIRDSFKAICGFLNGNPAHHLHAHGPVDEENETDEQHDPRQRLDQEAYLMESRWYGNGKLASLWYEVILLGHNKIIEVQG